jgi:hypothetical protein
MIKKRTQNESKDAHPEQKPFANPATPAARGEPTRISTDLVELRAGLFLNVDHIVSVRVLPEVIGNAYAVMQLSSGEKLNLTRDEFSTLCGVEARPPMRLARSTRE